MLLGEIGFQTIGFHIAFELLGCPAILSLLLINAQLMCL